MIPVPQTVLDLLATAAGTTAGQLKRFGGGEESSDGIVYAYPYQGSQRLLKIMAVPADEQRRGLLVLEERLRFVRFLGDNGAPIVFPQFSPQGNLYETMLFDNSLWIAYIMKRMDGRIRPEKSWDRPFFRHWGQAIGSLHRLTQQYPTWRGVADPESGQHLLFWQEEWEGFHNWCQDDAVKRQWLRIKEQLDALPVERDSFGFIHNDPHNWNILARPDGITLLDFDVANCHWFVNDIAIACQSILIFHSGGLNGPLHNRGKLLEFLQLFMEGYWRENQLSAQWLDRLDLFIAYRRILMFIVMNDWIRSNPDLRRSWKNLILSPPKIYAG